jgi:hypothetical protein
VIGWDFGGELNESKGDTIGISNLIHGINFFFFFNNNNASIIYYLFFFFFFRKLHKCDEKTLFFKNIYIRGRLS